MRFFGDLERISGNKWGSKIAVVPTYADSVIIRQLLHGHGGKVHCIPNDNNDCNEIIMIWDEKPSKEGLKALDAWLDGLFHGLCYHYGEKILFKEIANK